MQPTRPLRILCVSISLFLFVSLTAQACEFCPELRERYLRQELFTLSPEEILAQIGRKEIPADVRTELSYNYSLVNHRPIIEALDHGIHILAQIRHKESLSAYDVYALYYFGRMFEHMGNISSAVLLFEKALTEVDPQDEELTFWIKSRIATTGISLNEKKTVSLLKELDQIKDPELRLVHFFELDLLKFKGARIEVPNNVIDSIEHYINRYDFDHYLPSYLLRKMRTLYLSGGDLESFAQYLSRLEQSLFAEGDWSKSELRDFYLCNGEIYHFLNDTIKCEEYLNKAISTAPFSRPRMGDWSDKFISYRLKELIHEKGYQVFMSARHSRDLAVVKQSQQWFQLNLDLAMHHEKHLLDDLFGSLFMNIITDYSYDSYMLVSNYLYQQTCDSTYLEDQIYYADFYKALLLKKRLAKRAAWEQSGDKNFIQEREVFQDFLDAQTEYLLNQENWEDYIDHCFEKKIDKLVLDFELKRKYDLETSSKRFSLSEIRENLLKKKKTLIYINSGGANADIITVITPTDHHSYYAKYDKHQLDERIDHLFASIDQTANSTDAEELQALADQLHQFYREIFGPAEHLLTGELILLSDGPLVRLPYAAFLTEPVEDPTDMRSWPFLARRHQFTLAHSLQTQMYLQEQAPARETTLLAYAPLFTKGFVYREGGGIRYNFSPLENNIDEAAYAARHYTGQTALGEAATKESFLAQAGDYDILHLATHAKMNADFDLLSFVAFGEAEEDRLYSGNIFGLDLPAELVVLSACETAQGYDLVGEGPMSLSRAFAAAGAKSTVSTLWRVSDRESAQLAGGFYDHLAAGAAKDAALRAAQLGMLSGGSRRAAHPYYWAGYVLQGYPRPLPPRAGRDWRWPAGGGLLLLLGAGYWARRRVAA
jgi:CHAT domain-containing protein